MYLPKVETNPGTPHNSKFPNLPSWKS